MAFGSNLAGFQEGRDWRVAPLETWGINYCELPYVESLAPRDMKKLGKTGPDKAPDNGTYDWMNPDGTVREAGIPQGIDPGWNYTPGESQADRLREMFRKKEWPEGITRSFEKDIAPAPKNKWDKPFEPQKTAKDAEKWARDNDLSDMVDYTGIKAEVANAWNQALLESLRDFPELRVNQQYTGTIQAQYAEWGRIKTQEILIQYRNKYPGVADSILMPYVKKNIPKLRVPSDRYAHSWAEPKVMGIAVSKKFGSDIQLFTSQLKSDVSTKWHPEGCDSIKSVVDHEIGHQLDLLLGLSSDSEINSMFTSVIPRMGDEVSRYAKRNIGEFIAEGWSEYRNNSTPRPISKRIGEIIFEKYGNQHS
ncbi:hypothetical protein CCP4SC76_2650003 [Gammaproteobacteria bacterium]